jgi:flagellar biosynthesis protein FlhF
VVKRLRLVREIEFQARTENEAFRKVREKLGSDGIILSMQTMRSRSFIPFLSKKTLAVRAGILEEDRKKKEKEYDPVLEKKQVEVFKALLEYKASLSQKGEKEKIDQNPLEKNVEKVEDRIEISSSIPQEEKVSADKEPSIDTKAGKKEVVTNKGFKSEGFHQMQDSDIPAELAEQLEEEYSREGRYGTSFKEWFRSKSGRFCFEAGQDILIDALGGRKIMIVGPTGVGKTTTIAKIAAIAVQEGRSIALFTSDNYRVSAIDQIRTFSRVLNIPVEVINSGAEIGPLLDKYSPETLILMDTAGHGFMETQRIEHIEDIYNHFRPDAVHMTLSATSKQKDMKAALEVINRSIPVSRMIITKADETLGLGCLVSVPMTFDLPLSFVTTGQNVPRDISFATGELLTDLVFNGGGK